MGVGVRPGTRGDVGCPRSRRSVGAEAVAADLVVEVGLIEEGPLGERATRDGDGLQAQRQDAEFLGLQVNDAHGFADRWRG